MVCLGERHERMHGLQLRNVQRAGTCRATFSLDLAHQLFQAVDTAGTEYHMGTFGGDQPGRRFANTTAGTGNQYDFVFDVRHIRGSCCRH